MIYLDSYVQGEIPEPLTYQFLDAAGDPLDLSGDYDATFSLAVGTAAATSQGATVSDGVNGEVTYTWDGNDMDSTGVLRAEFVVTNGAQTFISERIVGYIRPAVVAPA